MKNRLSLLALICGLTALLLGPAAALDWPDALKLAQQNNPDLKSAVKQTESAQWSYYRSISSFLPQVSANASTGQTTSGTLAAASQSVSYGLSVSQSLFTGLGNYFSALSAKASYDYYQAAQTMAEANLYYQLRQTFIDLTMADENINLYKEIFERRKNNAELIALRFETGREDKGAMLRTKADQADAAYNISAAEQAMALAQLKLAQLLSVEVETADTTLEVKLPAKQDYDALLALNPAYLMQLKQLEQADLALKQTASEFLPSVSLSGSYRKSGADWSSATDSNSVSMNLSYAFFPGGSNIADRVIYSVKYDKAKEDFLSARNTLRYQVESAYRGLKDAVDAVGIAELSLTASAVRAEVARTKYMNGLMTYDSWDIIENDYINAQRTLLIRKKAALYAEAAWYNSYGGYIK